MLGDRWWRRGVWNRRVSQRSDSQGRPLGGAPPVGGTPQITSCRQRRRQSRRRRAWGPQRRRQSHRRRAWDPQRRRQEPQAEAWDRRRRKPGTAGGGLLRLIPRRQAVPLEGAVFWALWPQANRFFSPMMKFLLKIFGSKGWWRQAGRPAVFRIAGFCPLGEVRTFLYLSHLLVTGD